MKVPFLIDLLSDAYANTENKKKPLFTYFC